MKVLKVQRSKSGVQALGELSRDDQPFAASRVEFKGSDQAGTRSIGTEHNCA